MNTTQLECFVQVAQSLSFRRAADALHLSQPTVSKQVASLEAELGCLLFVRTTRDVMLSTLGESFLRDAQEILRLAYAAGERARRHAEGNGITVAYSDSSELMRLIPVLDALRREEDAHVTLAQGPRDLNLTRLTREQVDVVLGFESDALPPGVDFRVLRMDELACVVRVDSPLAMLEEAGPEDVGDTSQVLVQSLGLRRRGYRAQSSLPDTDGAKITVCSTSAEAYCLVDAGFGYALVPALYTMPDPFHKIVRWKAPVTVGYGMYCRKGLHSGMVPRFLELATEAFAQEGYAKPTTEVWWPGERGARGFPS
ncbi:MAG: LysR family transcriptional regulator [Atopobiaceae bacterium]|nr:LysR family transcriptional regulator [Atopobiaceae bacterium]